MVHFLGYLERSLVVVGCILLATYVGAFIDRSVVSYVEVKQFTSQSGFPGDPTVRDPHHPSVRSINQWSRQRVDAYERALAGKISSPIAILRISRLRLEAPVLKGTDELALNRGVGHIGGTVAPGEPGNIGIAGHRDGFFRVLKDVVVGDTIEIGLHDRLDFYRVTNMSIVEPHNVSVLRSHSTSTLTLVTCYPFFFLGSAPKRFIVQATRAGSVPLPTAEERLSPGVSPPRPLASQVSEPPTKRRR